MQHNELLDKFTITVVETSEQPKALYRRDTNEVFLAALCISTRRHACLQNDEQTLCLLVCSCMFPQMVGCLTRPLQISGSHSRQSW